MSLDLQESLESVIQTHFALLEKAKELPVGTRRKRGAYWWIKQGDGKWHYDPNQKQGSQQQASSTQPTPPAAQNTAQQRKESLSKDECYARLNESLKAIADEIGVVAGDDEAGKYIQENYDAIFKKAGNKNESFIYTKKLNIKHPYVMGGGAGKKRTYTYGRYQQQVWKQLQEDPASWNGDADFGKKMLEMLISWSLPPREFYDYEVYWIGKIEAYRHLVDLKKINSPDPKVTAHDLSYFETVLQQTRDELEQRREKASIWHEAWDYANSQQINVHLGNYLRVYASKSYDATKPLIVMTKQHWEEIQKGGQTALENAALEVRQRFLTEKGMKKHRKILEKKKGSSFLLATIPPEERKKILAKIEETFDHEHHSFKYKINGVYRIAEAPNRQAFYACKKKLTAKGYPETEFLYHGTHFAAAVGISRTQFKVTSNVKTGRMMGDGVYLAPNSSKSMQYLAEAFSRRTGARGVLFLCEAALGKVKESRRIEVSSIPQRIDKKQVPRLEKGDGYDSALCLAGSLRSEGTTPITGAEYCIRDASAVLPRLWIDLELT